MVLKQAFSHVMESFSTDGDKELFQSIIASGGPRTNGDDLLKVR
jgi:hypothetical protein